MNAPEKKPHADTMWDSIDLELEHAGTKIVLPDDPTRMTIDAGIHSLKKIKKAQETVYAINEKLNCHLYDGLVAFARALKEIYGFSQSVPTPGFFGGTPPQLVHVKTGPGIGDFVQVPFGRFELPNIDGFLQTGADDVRGIPMLVIGGQVKAKDKKIVMQLVATAQRIQKSGSIYKGRSIILEKDERGGNINFEEPLLFFDPSVGYEKPIYNQDTADIINVSIMAPLMKTDACRKANIPLKRGILLEGPYGTGKTLTAKYIAKTANANDWTFILVSSSQALRYALRFAKMYQPCVVFAEDIDRVIEERNEGANDLINEIDGVVSKQDEVMTILTTNFVNKIDKSMLRPGRLDTVIPLRPPVGKTVEELIRFYAGENLEKGTNLSEAVEKLSGTIPANIAEVVKKSKLAMLFHDRDKLSGKDIAVSADSMMGHLELLERASEGVKPVDPLSEAFEKVLAKRMEPLIREVLADYL